MSEVDKVNTKVVTVESKSDLDIWNAAIESAAEVIDQCNREGPYNAIGGAKRIRELKK